MNVAVVGTTSWGTTLAIIMAKQGHNVTLLARVAGEAEGLENERENRRFLPGFRFPQPLMISTLESNTFATEPIVIFAVPSKSLRVNAQTIASRLPLGSVIVSASKGLEMKTGLRMSQVLEEELPKALSDRICVLSGPNLSTEIAQGMPASTVLASADGLIASMVQKAFMSAQFRIYTSTDIVGVELGGALKNIIALGAGIGDGLQFGENSKAAFIARGLTEVTRFGVASGATALTFAGLAGMGDLIATAASRHSRNRYVGEQLAKGRDLEEILASMGNVVEGVDTTVAVLKMAKKLKVEMPITEATYRIMFERLNPLDALNELMGRAPQSEWAGVLP